MTKRPATNDPNLKVMRDFFCGLVIVTLFTIAVAYFLASLL